MLKKPCPYHKGPVNHTLEQCEMLKKYYNRVAHRDEDKKKDAGDKGGDDEFPPVENEQPHLLFDLCRHARDLSFRGSEVGWQQVRVDRVRRRLLST